MKRIIVLLFLISLVFSGVGQNLENSTPKYTRSDSLRGGVRPERTRYKVLKYNLFVDINSAQKYIKGSNTISFYVKRELPIMQLDLFENMEIDSILFRNELVQYEREENAVFISFPTPLQRGIVDSLQFFYSGYPIVAKTPPWDGGFIFEKDENGNDWVSVSVQGIGASLWYPNKDTQSDKVEEAEIHVITPGHLKNISNGRLTNVSDLPNGKKLWSWKVNYPINNYNLVFNIGDYVHFTDTFQGISMDYYVLPYHLKKARKQFRQAKKMMACFTERFGDYPFKEDGYKLIETPYLGMEHQSAIGYGNGFKNGYAGTDRSGTGVGLKWDFIIVHESGHEWFGNSITAADIADMWIHEAFTTYAEAVYIECEWGKEKAIEYLEGTLKTVVLNNAPIIGDYGVNASGSTDMYSKGAYLIHTLRVLLNNDEKWWNILKSFHETYQFQVVNTQDVVNYFNAAFPMDIQPIFDQFLRYKNIPILEVRPSGKSFEYRWNADVPHFSMPLDIQVKGKEERIYPTEKWKKIEYDFSNVTWNETNYRIKKKE